MNFGRIIETSCYFRASVESIRRQNCATFIFVASGWTDFNFENGFINAFDWVLVEANSNVFGLFFPAVISSNEVSYAFMFDCDASHFWNIKNRLN